jgi:hypothetical protein
VNWPACSSVASAATTLWPALCSVFAYAAPGLPRLQMRSGSEVIGALSVEAATAESGVSTREGGVCLCFARRGFFFFGVEGVEEVVAIEFGESALTVGGNCVAIGALTIRHFRYFWGSLLGSLAPFRSSTVVFSVTK